MLKTPIRQPLFLGKHRAFGVVGHNLFRVICFPVVWCDIRFGGWFRFLFSGLGAVAFFLAGPAEAQYNGGFGNAGMSGIGPSAFGGMGNQFSSGNGQNLPTGASGIIGGNRASLAGWQSYHNYRNAGNGQGVGGGTGGGEFARLGPARVSMGAMLGFAVNSNVNCSPTNPAMDGIVQASYMMGISWQATRRNLLELNLGFNYQQYLSYSQYNNNGLLIDPNTGLDYRIYFNDFVLSLFDYPSITSSGANSSPAITNSVNFSQLSNSGGFSLIWHPNQILCMAGLQRQDTMSLSNDAYSSQNSSGYSAFGTISYNFTPTTSTGLRVQASTTTYSQQILNNSMTSQAGLFLQTMLTYRTTIYFEAGLQKGTYTDTGQQTSTVVFQQTNGMNTNVEGTLGGGDYMQPYFNLQINNRFNRYLTQTLTLGRTASGSTVSNYQEMYTATYQLQYRLNRVTTVAMSANYQLGKISSATSSMPYSNWQGVLSLGVEAVKDTSLGLSYSYYSNNLPEMSASYTQQILAFTISHRF